MGIPLIEAMRQCLSKTSKQCPGFRDEGRDALAWEEEACSFSFDLCVFRTGIPAQWARRWWSTSPMAPRTAIVSALLRHTVSRPNKTVGYFGHGLRGEKSRLQQPCSQNYT